MGATGANALIFSSPNNNSAAVTNTTTETPFSLSQVISANTLTIGKTLEIHTAGYISTGISVGSLTIKVKLNGVTIITTNAVSLPLSLNNQGFYMITTANCRAVGTNGNLTANGFGIFNTQTIAGVVGATNAAAITIDTTQQQTITATAQWTVLGTAYSVTLEQLIVKIYG